MKKAPNKPGFVPYGRKRFPIGTLTLGLVLAISLCVNSVSFAQSTGQSYLLALSKNDHTLAIVDPTSLKIIGKVPVGPDPHEVIASADGKTAFVSNYAGGSLHELDVIDLVAMKSIAQYDTKPLIGLHGLTFANGKAWFTAEGSKAVGSFDPKTMQEDWAMGTGQDRTHMIYVTPDAKRIYTTNVSSGTVSILVDTLLQQNFGPPPGGRGSGQPGGPPPGGNPPPGAGGPPQGFRPQPHRDWEQTIIPVSKGSEGFDVSPDGKELWTASAQDGTIAIIDLVRIKLSTKVDAKAMGANRLKFTPDGKRVLVSSLGSGDVYVFDAATHQLITTVKTGHGAAGILMDPNGSRAFIGCSADNYVAIIDLKTMQVTGKIDVGGQPDGLAWAVR